MSNSVKKALLFFAVIFSCLFISNFALADDSNMMNSMKNGTNDVRNVVGGAENVVENAAGDAANGIKNGEEDMMDSAKNMTQDNGDYSASRTNGDDAGGTSAMANMTNGNNVWTWVVVAVLALVILGIIWYMIAKNSNNSNN